MKYDNGVAKSCLAFTEDISESGLFIRTANVVQPGKTIVINLEITENETVVIEGIVTWAKKVPPAMMSLIKKSGMGVRIKRISSGGSAYYSMYEELSHRRSGKPPAR